MYERTRLEIVKHYVYWATVDDEYALPDHPQQTKGKNKTKPKIDPDDERMGWPL